jgi:hypothetical protein
VAVTSALVGVYNELELVVLLEHPMIRKNRTTEKTLIKPDFILFIFLILKVNCITFI